MENIPRTLSDKQSQFLSGKSFSAQNASHRFLHPNAGIKGVFFKKEFFPDSLSGNKNSCINQFRPNRVHCIAYYSMRSHTITAHSRKKRSFRNKQTITVKEAVHPFLVRFYIIRYFQRTIRICTVKSFRTDFDNVLTFRCFSTLPNKIIDYCAIGGEDG